MGTPYMNLTLPTVSVTAGPLYATENNAAFTQIDQHNHTTGNGQQIPTLGLNINADLTFNQKNATSLRSTQYYNNASTITSAGDVTCLYFSGGNLYINNATGTPVQITAGNALNASSIGAIGGDYATSTASEFYTSSAQTFSFTSASTVPAYINCGPVKIRQATANGFGVNVVPNSSQAADYTLNLPVALPSAQSVAAVDASGNMTFPIYQLPPVASITMFAGASAPNGWLICDGSAVSRTTYAALFAIISTTYGAGDGSTTFNVPNTQGLFIRSTGSQSVGGLGYGGFALGQTANDTTKANGLSFRDTGHYHTYGESTVNVSAAAGGDFALPRPPSTQNTGTAYANVVVNTQDSETRPAFIALNYIIKY